MKKMEPKKRALVTGLNGFTGKYVADRLANAGFAVYGAGAVPCGLSGYFQMDLLDQVRLAEVVREVQPHVVVHLAAIAFVGHGDADAFYRVNVLGTRNLLGALAQHADSVEAVLLASSANVYGNSVAGALSEETPFNPANDYAVSKVAMEYMARLWMDRLPIMIARPFNYTGVGQSDQFLLPKIVDHFRRGERVIELGNIDVERDFSDVRMVVEIYWKLLELKPIGQVFNVCSGRGHSLSDVLAMMAEIAGYEIEVRINPAFVRQNEVRTLTGDATKLSSVVGPVNTIPLNETLRWMYRSA